MRNAFSLTALASASLFSAASAAISRLSTGITASANGWDTRIEGYGCAPSGCVPANAIDASIEPASRWSCKAEVSSVDACELTLVFDEPQDIMQMKIALWKGDQRTRAMNIWVDGELMSIIASSGTTERYENYELIAPQATTVVLQAAGMEDNGWLSVTGVVFLVDSEFEGPTPAPFTSTSSSGLCPRYTFSSDGTPPCTACSSGTISDPGATRCVPEALVGYRDWPEEILTVILADAVSGFAGAGYVISDTFHDYFQIISQEDGSKLEVSAIFAFYDERNLPASIALFTYLRSDDDSETFVRQQVVVDSSTGEFTATFEDIPGGRSTILFSFVVLDPADAPDDQEEANSVWGVQVVNNDCTIPLTITLEWDTDKGHIFLDITEPGGDKVRDLLPGRFGYVVEDTDDGGPGSFTYNLFGGDESAVGVYTADVQPWIIRDELSWTLTARVNGEVVWVEQGEYVPNVTDSDSPNEGQTNIFTVTFDSYTEPEC